MPDLKVPFATLVLALWPLAAVGSPAAAVRAAHADAVDLPYGVARQVRYLALYAVPEADREEVLRVLSFHCNSLSRESELAPPRVVGGGVVRINLLDYGWKAATYDKLAEADPYFHEQVTVVKETPGRYVYDAYGRGSWVAGKKQEVKQTAAARWLPAQEMTDLIAWTQSPAPVLRADWFVAYTAVQADRKVGYYDLLSLGKKEADFQTLIGADVVKAKAVKKEVAAAVARSRVTLNNRSMERFPTLTGAYWRTHDYKTNTFKQNTLRLLDGDTEPPQGDASEQYGTLPNGLFAFWLQNDKGERQDTAPDFIASDGQATGTDRRVHVGLSCIRCHTPGIQPIDDWTRRVYRGAVQLQSPDYEKLKRLQRLYLSDLEGQVKRDQADYAEALRKTNGLTPEVNAKAYARLWDRYVEHDRLPADVARECGVTELTLLASLKAYVKRTGQLDPILAGLLQTPPVPVRAEHSEEVFPLLMQILGGG